MGNTKSQLNREIKEIKKKIEELKKGWPAHSADPARLQQLEKLEEKLTTRKRDLKELND